MSRINGNILSIYYDGIECFFFSALIFIINEPPTWRWEEFSWKKWKFFKKNRARAHHF